MGAFLSGLAIGRQTQKKKDFAGFCYLLMIGEAKRQKEREGHELYQAKILDLQFLDLVDASKGQWIRMKNDIVMDEKRRAEFADVLRKSFSELKASGETVYTKEEAVDAILKRFYGDGVQVGRE